MQFFISGFGFWGRNCFYCILFLLAVGVSRLLVDHKKCERERIEQCPLHLRPFSASHAADTVTHRQVGLWIILLPPHDCPFNSLALSFVAVLLFANSYSREAHSDPKVSVGESCRRAQGLSKQGETVPPISTLSSCVHSAAHCVGLWPRAWAMLQCRPRCLVLSGRLCRCYFSIYTVQLSYPTKDMW